MALTLASAAFVEGSRIPARFTCQGSDISPALSWSGAPRETHSLAVIVEDPDAPGGVFTHWLIFNLPASVASLPEGASPRGRRPAGSVEGRNDFGEVGYSGPCPPPGRTHRYYFKVYALSGVLELKSGAGRAQFLDAIKPVILAESQVMGTYQRA